MLSVHNKIPRSIEFVGLPGAGKTTIARALKTKLHSSGYQVFSARELFCSEACKYFDLGLSKRLRFRLELYSRNRITRLITELRGDLFSVFSGKYPEYVELCTYLIGCLPYPKPFRDKLYRWLEEEGAGWVLHDQSQGDGYFYLNDEGFIHRALSYYLISKPSIQDIMRYIDSCPVHDKVVFVNSSIDCVYRRRINKPNYAFEVIGVHNDSEKINILANLNMIVSVICSNFKSEKSIVLNGEESAESNTSLVFSSVIFG